MYLQLRVAQSLEASSPLGKDPLGRPLLESGHHDETTEIYIPRTDLVYIIYVIFLPV